MKKIASNKNYRLHKTAQAVPGAGCEQVMTLLQELAPLIRDLHRSMAEGGNAPSQKAESFELPAMGGSTPQVNVDELSEEQLREFMNQMFKQ